MTLSTTVNVLRPVNPRELLDFINEHLLQVVNPRIEEDETSTSNGIGQGFDAWVTIKHAEDPTLPILPGSRRDYEASYKNMLEWYTTGDGVQYLHGLSPEVAALKSVKSDFKYDRQNSFMFAQIDFDTAYGYTGKNGLGCGDLHAAYIRYLADNFFTPRDIPFTWDNEFTGERFKGTKGLDTLGKGGAEATDWFRNTVKPVIEAEFGGNLTWV